MLKIWVGSSPEEGWKWARTINIAKQLIELYWQDQWETWYIDNIPREKIENECIISLPTFNLELIKWLQSHKASSKYEVFVREGEKNARMEK